MDWGEWRRAYPVFSSVPFFRDLMDSGIVSLVPDHSDDQFGRQAARVAAAAGKVDNLVDYLTREIAVALKTTPERVPVNVPLPSLGFDSLMAVEIKNRIEIDLQVEMPVVKLLEGQSINQLSDFISIKLTDRSAAVTGSQQPSGAGKTKTDQNEQVWEEGVI
jgi:acyl carrier protein